MKMILLVTVVCFAFIGDVPGGENIIPADKKLSGEWVDKLFERGERAVYRGKDLDKIRMPVGGIAAGQLYLHGDGRLGPWLIFNQELRMPAPKAEIDHGFAVVMQAGGETEVRQLSSKGFSQVEFAGEYPIGVVRYGEEGYPLKVEMEAFSPFIPLNANDSSLPATVFNITIRNASQKPVQVGVLGWLENAVFLPNKTPAALAVSKILRQKGRTLILHAAEEYKSESNIKPRPDVVFADFEGPDYGDWQVTGATFGKGPVKAEYPVKGGFQGNKYVLSNHEKNNNHGTLTSPPFEVSRRYINFLIGGSDCLSLPGESGNPGQVGINLLVDGKPVRMATGTGDGRGFAWDSWNVAEFAGKQAQIEIVNKPPAWNYAIRIDHVEFSDMPRMPLDKHRYYGSMALILDGEGESPELVRGFLSHLKGSSSAIHSEENVSYRLGPKRSAATASKLVELAPGAERTFCFVLSWYFPNMPNNFESTERGGRNYANRFNSARAVAEYILDNQERLVGNTRKWHKTFYEDSTLPRWLLFRLHSTVANLASGTCQWWKNGRFWAYEGVSCCEGTCTHVWNYAHAHARLFPEIARSICEMQDFGAGFNEFSCGGKSCGLVGYRGEGTANPSYPCPDGHCGAILKAYREHQISKDSSFLKRNWPRIKKAIEWSIYYDGSDGNEDGLIENIQANTYDVAFYGPNTFVGSLYLAALCAGEQMALELGEEEFAKRCRKVFESGRRLSDERLWNGEYFFQIVDLEKHPKHQYGKGCLSDQLFGQGWAHQLGLGYLYAPEHVREALRSVWKYNWAPDTGPYNAMHKPERPEFAGPGEAGLFTCTWPKSDYLKEGMLYKNEVWTGIEYQSAGHMIWEGMLTEPLVICRGVHERYHPGKRNPFNEIECGDHYARALASWGVYAALAGYEYHGPKGHIGFDPRLKPENFRAAFTAAEGWGSFSQERKENTQTERIEMRWGELRLRSLAFKIPPTMPSPVVTLKAAGKDVQASSAATNGRLSIELANDLILKENDVLEIAIKNK